MIVDIKDLAEAHKSGPYFGVASREQTVTALLKLARAIADGRVLVQSAEVGAKATADDWLFTTFSLVYAESEQPLVGAGVDTGKIKFLYGFDNIFQRMAR